jgi:hypothetical protein
MLNANLWHNDFPLDYAGDEREKENHERACQSSWPIGAEELYAGAEYDWKQWKFHALYMQNRSALCQRILTLLSSERATTA